MPMWFWSPKGPHILDLRCRSALCPHTCLVSRRCGRSHDQHGWAPNGIDGGPCRVVIHAPDAAKLERAKEIIRKGRRNMGRNDIWHDPDFLLREGQLAFLFPGIEARFSPQISDLMQVLNSDPLPEFESGDVEAHGYALVRIGQALTKVMDRWAIEPQMVAGHSVGEWTAMIASEAIPKNDIDAFMSSLVPGTLDVPGVLFLAAGCSEAKARDAIVDLPDIHLSHDNCPRQVILCGIESSIRTCQERLSAQTAYSVRSCPSGPDFTPHSSPIISSRTRHTLHRSLSKRQSDSSGQQILHLFSIQMQTSFDKRLSTT